MIWGMNTDIKKKRAKLTTDIMIEYRKGCSDSKKTEISNNDPSDRALSKKAKITV